VSKKMVRVSGQVCLDFTLIAPEDTKDKAISEVIRKKLCGSFFYGELELITDMHLPGAWEVQEDERAPQPPDDADTR